MIAKFFYIEALLTRLCTVLHSCEPSQKPETETWTLAKAESISEWLISPFLLFIKAKKSKGQVSIVHFNFAFLVSQYAMIYWSELFNRIFQKEWTQIFNAKLACQSGCCCAKQFFGEKAFQRRKLNFGASG